MELGLAAWALGALLAAVGESFPVEHKEPVTIRLQNGRSGQPLARARVTLIAGYSERDLEQRLWRDEVVTDATGEVRVPRVLGDFSFLKVQVAKAKLCQDTSRGETHSLERIRSERLRALNHCGVVVGTEAPRVLVVFARRSGEPDTPVLAAPQELRVDFAADADSETVKNELSRGSARGLVRTSMEIGVGASWARAGAAASVSAREVQVGPGRTALRTRHEIDLLVGRQGRGTGFWEAAGPVFEGTEPATESYETMCQREDSRRTD